MIASFARKISLGKGEVVSSILTGSTTYPTDIIVFSGYLPFRRSGRFRQNRAGIGTSTRGKSVESVPVMFAG